MGKSKELFQRAQAVIPGGVNSPVRAFKAVEGTPPYIAGAQGCYIYDVDGNEYVDFVCSWGPMILGHAHPQVIEAVQEAATRGTSFGANCEIEVKMAEFIVNAVPSIEKVRMVSSGTEATMSAIRLARAYTERPKIIKFEGCYHGHADSFLSKAGSGAMTFGIPGTPGVTPATAGDTLNAPYNDLDSVQQLIDENRDQIAAIIVEPVAGNMGVVLPQESFLQGLRDLASENGIVLIFDEVITGFRLGLGGAQELFGVRPDLTTLGKIIGGGLPVGAFGGKKEIMDLLAPEGPVYQAGTLSGNPLALTAGLRTLQILTQEGTYAMLREKASYLFDGMAENFNRVGIPVSANSVESMGCFFFQGGPVRNYKDAIKSDVKQFSRYHQQMMEHGVYLAPSQFEATFVSLVHSKKDLDRTLDIHEHVCRKIA